MSRRFPLARGLAALLILAAPAIARGSDAWQVTTWTTDDALPQGVVYAIRQTRDGYVWFTTLGGLVRYDGVDFTVFARAITRGLRSSRFTTLFEASDGSLWAGTEDGFVSVYRNGAFASYPVDGSLSPVVGISEDGSSRPFVVTHRGVFAFERGRFVRVGPSVATHDFVYRTGVAAVEESGVAIHDPQRGTTRPIMRPARELRLVAFDERTLWVVDVDGRTVAIRDGRVTNVDQPLLRELVRSEQGALTALTRSRDGAFWIATTRGVARIETSHVDWITAEDGLCGPSVARLYEDRDGTMWATCLGGGLSAFHPRAARTYVEGLRRAIVYPILTTRGGGLVVGSWGDGVYRFDGRRFERSIPDTGAILSLAEDREGALWVAVHAGLVLRIRGTGVTTFGVANGLPPVVRVIHVAKDGRLWFGTNDGLATAVGADRFIVHRAPSLDLSFIQAIAEEPDGSLLLGTRGGLVRFRGGRFALVASDATGLAGNAVRAIHLDRDGTIWAGTYDGGLARIRNGRVASITTREGLYDNGVFAILEESGFFWMSSNRGVHRASRRELNAVADGTIRAISSLALTRADGMLSAECNGGVQPAAARTADGLLWFPTQQGIVSIDPKRVRMSLAAPPIHVTSVAVDGEAVSPSSEVRIAPGSRRVEFRFVAPTTANARLIRYRYRLEGFDERWNDLVGERVATYTHVPPGRYRFVVIASNADGRWSATPATTGVRVLPPFWRTWWFVAAVVALVIALLWAIHRLRMRKIEREQAAQAEFSRRLLVQQEDERKRVAAELHDSIGQSLLVIKNRALLGIDRNDPEQLTEISTTASSAIDEVRRIAHNLRPVELDHLGLAGSVEALLRRMSASSPILFSGELDPVGHALTKEAEVNLFRIVQEWLSNVARHSQATAVLVSLKRDDGMLRLRIRDDGTGFPEKSSRAGIGLKSIAERVQMLGGTFDIRSTSGEGTSMSVDVPLRSEA